MKDYEVMFILRPALDEVINPNIEKYEELITKNGGKVEHTDKWGKKRLAYTIREKLELHHNLAQVQVKIVKTMILKIWIVATTYLSPSAHPSTALWNWTGL